VDAENADEIDVTHSDQCFKNAMDATCERQAALIDRVCFRDSRGHFLRSCRLYKTPSSVYAKLLSKMEDMSGIKFALFPELRGIVKEHEFLDWQLNMAVHSIADGNFVELKKSCWECGEPSEELKTCTCCRVANYCSKICQVKAWRSGHKLQCKHLPSRYEVFEES
jgi:hypothetical protein